MKKKFNMSKSKNAKGLVLLQRTTALHEVQTESWAEELLELYKLATCPMERAAVTVLNALLTHGRRYVCLSRAAISQLVRDDINHQPQAGFSNETYPALRRFLIENDYLKIFEKGQGHSADSFEVVDPEITKFLSASDLDSQIEQVRAFSRASDGKSDIEGRRKIAGSSIESNLKDLTKDEVSQIFLNFKCRFEEAVLNPAMPIDWIEEVLASIKTASPRSVNKLLDMLVAHKKESVRDHKKFVEKISGPINDFLKPYLQGQIK